MEKQIAVITGGTRGIGKALVEKYVKEGYRVFTCSRNQEALGMLKEEIGDDLHVCTADLSQKEGTLAFGDFVLSKTDVIDVLINNTGVFIPGQIHKEEEGNLELQINTNLYSAYHLTRKLVDIFIDARKGHIFNICSIASITPYANGGSYSISKYAMYGMTKCLREEMKEFGVKVTAVLPGAVFTSSWEEADIDEERLMPSKDIADIIFATSQLSARTVTEDIVLRPQLGDL